MEWQCFSFHEFSSLSYHLLHVDRNTTIIYCVQQIILCWENRATFLPIPMSYCFCRQQKQPLYVCFTQNDNIRLVCIGKNWNITGFNAKQKIIGNHQLKSQKQSEPTYLSIFLSACVYRKCVFVFDFETHIAWPTIHIDELTRNKHREK